MIQRRVLCFVPWTASLWLGCGAPPDVRSPQDAALTDQSTTVPPKSDVERRVLEQLARTPTSGEQRVGSATVIIDDPYFSASGRTCRRITFKQRGTAHVKLACQQEGSWSFVPNVFAATEGG